MPLEYSGWILVNIPLPNEAYEMGVKGMSLPSKVLFQKFAVGVNPSSST